MTELLLTIEVTRHLRVVVIVDDIRVEERRHGCEPPDANRWRAFTVEALMRCQRCDQSDRIPVRRAKLAERAGRVAVVLGVPVEECPACGDRWLDFDTARRLDEMLTGMLASDAEIVTRHFDTHGQSAA